MKDQHCYATHRNDVGKQASPFRVRLRHKAKRQTKRCTKFPIQYSEKLEYSSVNWNSLTFLDKLVKLAPHHQISLSMEPQYKSIPSLKCPRRYN